MIGLQPGVMVNGYRILREVGRGGMAVVYLAHQENLGRDVALKLLPAALVLDPDLLTRFQLEARAVASLRHPAILVIHDVGAYQEQPYLVTEFVDGGTLAPFLGTPQSVATVLRLLGPIAGALDYAHARGLLHRDVKPANILLRRDGSPVLADFGLALAAEAEQRLTRTGLIMGTPEYMAPEQATQPSSALTPAVDRYALAVIAYELLTGRLPFGGATTVAVVMAKMTQAPPPPRTINPAIAPAVEAVLLHGLAIEPEQRYLSATAFVEALAADAPPEVSSASRSDLPATVLASTRIAPQPAATPAGQATVAAHVPWAQTMPGSKWAEMQPTKRVQHLPKRNMLLVVAIIIALVAALSALALGAYALHGNGQLGAVRSTETATKAPTATRAASVVVHASPDATIPAHIIAVSTPKNTSTVPPPPTATTAFTFTPIATVRPTDYPTYTPLPTYTQPPTATLPPVNTATDVPTATAAVTLSQTKLTEPPWIASILPGYIVTVAGTGATRIDNFGRTVGTYSGDGGPASLAGLSRPYDVALNHAGDLIIVDTFNNRIRKVSRRTGIISNIADNGDYHYGGDGGPAVDAGISPNGAAFDYKGNLYIADSGNYRVRKVTTATGMIDTVAGTGTYGYSGDGGSATNADLSLPNDVYLDTAGNLYIADKAAETIRKVALDSGIITTVAGNGILQTDENGKKVGTFSGDGGPAWEAGLNRPSSVTSDHNGDLFIADANNNRIRRVDGRTGIITTVAGDGRAGFGGDGGPAITAELSGPECVIVDSIGNLYISDTSNNRIRKVDARTSIISTIAGNGVISSGGGGTYIGDRRPAMQAALNQPRGLAMDAMGNLYIADSLNNRVRVVRGVARPR